MPGRKRPRQKRPRQKRSLLEARTEPPVTRRFLSDLVSLVSPANPANPVMEHKVPSPELPRPVAGGLPTTSSVSVVEVVPAVAAVVRLEVPAQKVEAAPVPTDLCANSSRPRQRLVPKTVQLSRKMMAGQPSLSRRRVARDVLCHKRGTLPPGVHLRFCRA